MSSTVEEVFEAPKGKYLVDFYGDWARAGIAADTARKSRFAEPVYYLFDNRGRTRTVVSTVPA